MNKKKILTVMLMTIILICALTLQSIGASVEIDRKGKIDFPRSVYNGQGTMSISTTVGSYTMYYQVIEMSESMTNLVNSKINTINSYITETGAELEELSTEADRLKEIAETTKTEEDIAAFNKAVDDYNSKLEEYITMKEELIKEYELSTPNFNEESWKLADNNKFQIDTSNYSGIKEMGIWIKVVTSEDTIYDFAIYTMQGDKEETTISLDKTTTELEIGKTVQLKVTTNSTETVQWSSNKENVATVNSSGVVTGIAKGTATITATVEGKTATCIITVKEKTQSGGTETDDGLTWTDFYRNRSNKL